LTEYLNQEVGKT